MADLTAMAKVEDAFAAVLSAYEPLADYTVLVDQSVDIAVEADTPTIIVWTVAVAFENAFEQGTMLNIQTLEFEVLQGDPAVGTISRANQAALAHVLACIAADRSLGGRLEDAQEIDMAPTPNGKDVGSASLQIRAQYHTPSGDPFTIIGQADQNF